MGLGYGSNTLVSLGSRSAVIGSIAFDSSYPTGGEAFNLALIGLSSLDNIYFQETSGFSFQYDYTANAVKALVVGASTPTFTGTAPTSSLNLATPAFSGTGLTAAGQVITTTSTHTMTLNQCAGMWLISATGATPPNLILSNTAVAGAAAVLTVQGSANTDAGAYKIVKALTPVGTVSTSAAAEAEVGNATDLSALTVVRFIAVGV